MYRHYNDILSAKLREYFEEDMLFMSVSLLTEELAPVAVPGFAGSRIGPGNV